MSYYPVVAVVHGQKMLKGTAPILLAGELDGLARSLDPTEVETDRECCIFHGAFNEIFTGIRE